MRELLKLVNDDYQKRGNKAPKPLIPDSIHTEIGSSVITIEFDFKNTSDSDAIKWYEKSKEYKAINKFNKDFNIAVSTSKDGDYKDDWQKLRVELTKKDSAKVVAVEPKKQTATPTTKKLQTAEASDTSYTYCYILSTLQQRKSIDLTKHKSQLEKIIESYFGDRLVSLKFNKESYTLTLTEEYEVADKRRLGRLISEGSGLKQYVRKILYNGNQDTSGQLFRIKRGSK